MARQEAASQHKYVLELLKQSGIKHRFGNWRGKVRSSFGDFKEAKRSIKSAEMAFRTLVIVTDRDPWYDFPAFRDVFKDPRPSFGIGRYSGWGAPYPSTNKRSAQTLIAVAFIQEFGYNPDYRYREFEALKKRVHDSEAAAKALLVAKSFGLTGNNLREFVFTTTDGLDLNELEYLESTVQTGKSTTLGDNRRVVKYPIVMPPNLEDLTKLVDFIKARKSKNELLRMPDERLRLLLQEHSKIPTECRAATIYALKHLSVTPTQPVFEKMIEIIGRLPGIEDNPILGKILENGTERLVIAWNQFSVTTPEEVTEVAEAVMRVSDWAGIFVEEAPIHPDRLPMVLEVAKKRKMTIDEFSDFTTQVGDWAPTKILAVLDSENISDIHRIQQHFASAKAARAEHQTDRPAGRS